MRDRSLVRESATKESLVKGRTLSKATDFVRREAAVAFPAAKRAGVHAARVFLRKFSEEYAKERRRHGRRSKNIN
ncbi:MAG: hypothetical protein H0U04_17825 [Rubrobacter sp.]|nr:hypothetical protein [Rubrobacter sp.]